jgi:hypothetical protein
VGLCKGNGILYRAGLKILARSSGRAFLSALMCPLLILFDVSY